MKMRCGKCIRFKSPRCHKCPDMPDRAYLPGCMGMAVYDRKSRCTCGRRSQEARNPEERRTLLTPEPTP